MVQKRSRMAKVVVMVCLTALTAFAGIAQANGDFGGGRHHFKKISEKLALTDAQKTQAKAIFQANRTVVKPLFESLRTEHKALQALIHADAVDEAAIRAESAKIALIQADLNVNRATAGVQFRAILTPAQLAILKTLPHRGEPHAGPPEP